MKRLFYLLAIVLFISVFSACSSQDSLDEISIEVPESTQNTKKRTAVKLNNSTSSDKTEGNPFDK